MLTKPMLARVGGVLALAVLALGCSTDSPTAPVQTPAPPPGTGEPSADWIIEVTVSPDELTINADQPATVTITVRRADNNQTPASGTTIVVSTSLGELQSLGSGISTAALATVGGRAQVLLFAGPVVGTALVSATLEDSVGQSTFRIVGEIEPIEAAFTFQNSENNLSVTFLNQSTGNPTEFLWNFGDGTTSTEENPHHVFPYVGDFVVSLTASKEGASDTAQQIVLVGEVPDPVVADFDFQNSEDNLSVTFINLSTGDPTSFFWDFGDGTTSREEHPVHIFPRKGDFVVSLRASRTDSSDEVAKVVVVGDSTALFITSITPNTGPAGGGTTVTISGSGFESLARVFFGGKLGTVTSVTSTTVTVVTPPGDMNVEDCDSTGDGTADGTRELDTPVTVTVETENGRSESLANAFTYLSSTGEACVPN